MKSKYRTPAHQLVYYNKNRTVFHHIIEFILSELHNLQFSEGNKFYIAAIVEDSQSKSGNLLLKSPLPILCIFSI